MMIFRVEIQCDGCKTPFDSRTHDNPMALGELAGDLVRSAKENGWAIDGAAQWCPRCTRREDAAAAEADEQRRRLERMTAQGGVQ